MSIRYTSGRAAAVSFTFALPGDHLDFFLMVVTPKVFNQYIRTICVLDFVNAYDMTQTQI